MEFNNSSVVAQPFGFEFKIDIAVREVHKIPPNWEVLFFPMTSGEWCYGISILMADAKNGTIKDCRETGRLENYRSVCYLYAERLLIDFLNDRY